MPLMGMIEARLGSERTRHGPRERIQQLGESRLSDAEALSLVLRTGTRDEPVEFTAQRLLRRFGGLPGLASASLREVAGQRGIGPVRAAALCAAFGLARRLGEAQFRPGVRVHSGLEVARIVRDSVRSLRQEAFFVALLDARHRLLSLQLISIGSLDATQVHPREVFGPAIRDGAVAVVVAHNHPSGDPSPSADDTRITERLRAVGTLLGIDLLDHVVVGGERYYSFATEQAYAFR